MMIRRVRPRCEYRSIVPQTGERLQLRYAESIRFKHRFYTEPPGEGGRRVCVEESCVDLAAVIHVEQVYVSVWEGHQWISVRFTNWDGIKLWTNYAKDGHVWMRPAQRARSPSLDGMQ